MNKIVSDIKSSKKPFKRSKLTPSRTQARGGGAQGSDEDDGDDGGGDEPVEEPRPRAGGARRKRARRYSPVRGSSEERDELEDG